MRFSSRLSPTLEPSPLAIAVERARDEGLVRFDLTCSNPTDASLALDLHGDERDAPTEADALLALADPRALVYAPHAQGLAVAREAVAAHYRQRGAPVDPARVWIAASTSEIYAQLFMLHCDPGDEVLVAQPSYPLLDSLAALTSVRVRRYALAFDGRWHIDLRALRSALTERTRLIVSVSPNNPTGNPLRRAELDALVTLCADRAIALVSDEVFGEYGPYLVDGRRGEAEGDRVDTTAREQRCLCWTLGGLSKTAAMPQMKLAWAIASGPLSLVREAEARFEHVADAFLSAGAPAQWALPTLLARGAIARRKVIERVERNLAVAREVLSRDVGVSALECEGGWTMVLRVPAVRSDEAWARALLEEDAVLVQPGYLYDFEREGYLVVSLLTEPSALRAGLEAIARRAARDVDV